MQTRKELVISYFQYCFQMKIANNQYSSTDSEILQEDEKKAKRGHVLTELKETEQVYVSELQTILTVRFLFLISNCHCIKNCIILVIVFFYFFFCFCKAVIIF